MTRVQISLKVAAANFPLSSLDGCGFGAVIEKGDVILVLKECFKHDLMYMVLTRHGVGYLHQIVITDYTHRLL